MTTLDSLPGPRTAGFLRTVEFAFAPRFFTPRPHKRYGRVYHVPAPHRQEPLTPRYKMLLIKLAES